LTEYDECKDCGGYCCSGFGTPCHMSEEEVVRIARHLDIPFDVFTELYAVKIEMFEEETPWVFKQGWPCRFWTQGRSGIHAVKPSGCASYGPYKNIDHIGPVTIVSACSQYYRKEIENGDVFPWWQMLKTKAKVNEVKQ